MSALGVVPSGVLGKGRVLPRGYCGGWQRVGAVAWCVIRLGEDDGVGDGMKGFVDARDRW